MSPANLPAAPLRCKTLKVLLLDEGFMSGVHTAFGLREAGCDVDVLAAAGGSGPTRGGDISWRLAPRTGDPDLVDAIGRLLDRKAFDVIYPLTEPLQRLTRGGRGVFPAFAPWLVPLLDDKRRMSGFVARQGVRVPMEHRAGSEEDLRAGARALGLPLVVKGSVGRGGAATAIVTSIASARRAVSRIRRRGADPFLQQYIHGPTFLAGGLFDSGSALRLYTGQKTVQFPARTGPAATLVSTDDARLVTPATTTFLATRMTGLASADFIRDSAGVFYFLELNPRPWGSITAARDAGVDLFHPLVDLWSGRAVEPCLGHAAGVRSAVYSLPRIVRFVTRSPAASLHIAHRLSRVAMNWRHS